MNKLHILILQRLKELGQEAFTIHEDLMRHRLKPLENVEKTKMSVDLKGCIEKQYEWLNALIEEENNE